MTLEPARGCNRVPGAACVSCLLLNKAFSLDWTKLTTRRALRLPCKYHCHYSRRWNAILPSLGVNLYDRCNVFVKSRMFLSFFSFLSFFLTQLNNIFFYRIFFVYINNNSVFYTRMTRMLVVDQPIMATLFATIAMYKLIRCAISLSALCVSLAF